MASTDVMRGAPSGAAGTPAAEGHPWSNPRRLKLLRRVRPEIPAGDYARDDTAIVFYQRIHALLRPDMAVLDFGAGRGTSVQPQFKSFHAEVQRLKGKVRRLVGVDVDPAVLEHPSLDERLVIVPGAPLPFPDASFDLVLCQWVIEHLDDPAGFAGEMHRLLKPGGWLCAITPNRWGHVGILTNLLPNRTHSPVLRWVIPERAERDVFPTCYRLNTLGAVRRHFPETRWFNGSFAYNGLPRYHANSYLLFSLVDFYQRITPPVLATDLMLFLRRQPG